MHVTQGECDGAVQVGWGIPVAVIAPAHAVGAIGVRIARQGGVPVDPAGGMDAVARLVVIDADGCGGERSVLPYVARLRRRRPELPVILLSRACEEQVFPPRHSGAPLRLRAPLSPVALRTALEYLFGQGNGAPRTAERPVQF